MSTFEEKLASIKNRPEQLQLIAMQKRSWWQAIVLSAIAGSTISATVLYFNNLNIWLAITLIVTAIILLIKSEKILFDSSVLGKEQDRQYFLMCLSISNNIQELEKAGLFGDISAHDKEDLVEKISTSKNHLTDALNNGETQKT